MARAPSNNASESVEQNDSAPKSSSNKPKSRRTIPGDFSYTTTPGKLKTALEKLLVADRPDIFNRDFIETYLNVTGGSAAPIPNILKRIGFIATDGKPTDLYGKFQSDTGRPEAALEGLKKGFSELFKKNIYAHSLPEEKIKDILVEITGLKKSDQVISQIYGTFDAIRGFIPPKFVPSSDSSPQEHGHGSSASDESREPSQAVMGLGLSYHINIVLPETRDVSVFNAIFQSLKQNLLSGM